MGLFLMLGDSQSALVNPERAVSGELWSLYLTVAGLLFWDFSFFHHMLKGQVRIPGQDPTLNLKLTAA